MSDFSAVAQHSFPRKEMLFAALLFCPGEDFSMLGSWSDPQILMDLSTDELAYLESVLVLFRPALDGLAEADLVAVLGSKMALMGDPVSRIFDAANRP